MKQKNSSQQRMYEILKNFQKLGQRKYQKEDEEEVKRELDDEQYFNICFNITTIKIYLVLIKSVINSKTKILNLKMLLFAK